MIKKIKTGGEEERAALRRGYVGGSDAGAVMGRSPYKGPYRLWAEKTGRLPEFSGSVAAKVGLYLEALVARLFTEETGRKVRRVNATLLNDRYPYAAANLDRLVSGERALLEIKTTNTFDNMKLIRGGEYPDAWHWQVVHYLAVTELEKAYIAALVGGRDFRIFEVVRDEEEIRSLMAAEESFWQHVTEDTPPAPSGCDSDADAILALHPEGFPQEADLFEREDDAREYTELSSQLKELKERQDVARNRLCAALGDADTGVCGPYTVTWKSQSRRTLDTKRLEREKPGLTDGYYGVSSTRVFKVR